MVGASAPTYAVCIPTHPNVRWIYITLVIITSKGNTTVKKFNELMGDLNDQSIVIKYREPIVLSQEEILEIIGRVLRNDEEVATRIAAEYIGSSGLPLTRAFAAGDSLELSLIAKMLVLEAERLLLHATDVVTISYLHSDLAFWKDFTETLCLPPETDPVLYTCSCVAASCCLRWVRDMIPVGKWDPKGFLNLVPGGKGSKNANYFLECVEKNKQFYLKWHKLLNTDSKKS